MADARGAVIIVVALIGAAATIIAALIARSGGETATPPVVPSVVPGTTTLPVSPVPAKPEPGTPESEAGIPEPTVPPAQVSPPDVLPGDLGVSRPITRPACDGRFLVFVGAAVYPPTYRIEVQKLLDTYSDSEYLRASDTCPSLRPRDAAGNEIYGVYYGPFTAREQACSARSSLGGDSYVKVLDTVTDSGVIIEC